MYKLLLSRRIKAKLLRWAKIYQYLTLDKGYESTLEMLTEGRMEIKQGYEHQKD